MAGDRAYDYSQPINTVSAPPAESDADEAATLFGSARDSFKQGNYRPGPAAGRRRPGEEPQRLVAARVPRALPVRPGTVRRGRHCRSTPSSRSGPGWDWPTLIGLYPNVNVYTSQLRALEDYGKANPQSASGRFVLAYHYLTQGHYDAAANMLRQVVALKPNDTLSAKLLEQLQAAKPQQRRAHAGRRPAGPAAARPRGRSP